MSHVFLSYSRADREDVTQIAEALKSRGIEVWFDEWELQPGLPWEQRVEDAIRKSHATAVFIGPKGLGKWEEREMRAALQEQLDRNCPVVPVFLPHCPPDMEKHLPGFLKSHTWVDFRQRPLLDEHGIRRLRWGITGQKPTEDREQPQRPPNPPVGGEADYATTNLARFLKSGNVTFYIGPGALCADTDLIPSACEMARALLREIDVIPEGYTHLLPPVDIAGMYYAVKSSDATLENSVIDFVMSRTRAVPQTHAHLAALLKALGNRPPRRVRQRVPQLIVTTNYDVSMERALLRAGIDFTRIVQHRSAQRINVNEYKGVGLADDGWTLLLPLGGDAQSRVPPDDYETLDAFITDYGASIIDQPREPGANNPLDELPVQEMTEPVLYKLLGSQDVPNSCAISTDHFFTFARRALKRNCIPAKVTEIIANTPALFLGYNLLDPDFRITYYTLLRKPFEFDMDMRYAVQPPPDHFRGDTYREMESGLWESIKKAGLTRLKITTIEERSEAFLEELLRKVTRS